VREDGVDSRAFEALYVGLFPLVIRTVYLVVLDRDIAQEITHEAFLRLWQNRQRLGEHPNEKAWLMRVAVNLALDHRRSLLTALRHRQAEPPMPDPARLRRLPIKVNTATSAGVGGAPTHIITPSVFSRLRYVL